MLWVSWERECEDFTTFCFFSFFFFFFTRSSTREGSLIVVDST